jgi:beta-glucanase (GH16 family)
MVAAMAGVVLHAAQAQSKTAPLTRSPDGRPLVMTFSDNFDSLRLVRPGEPPGQGVWRTTFGEGGGLSNRTLVSNQEMQLYVDPDMADAQGRPMGLNPFSVKDGVLDIFAAPTEPRLQAVAPDFPYMSGMISSRGTFSQLYGYFEARVKLPAGKGLWPAIWLLPADYSWPPEIDIMESIGDPMKAWMTVHSGRAKTPGVEVHPILPGFHTYAVSWDPQNVIFYLDGQETQRNPTPADMTKPMFVMANLAVGGVWAGPPDQNTRLPAKFSVDFIRVYRFAS